MKKNILVIITLLALTVAVGGVSFGVKANNRKRMAEQENQALRDRLALPADPVLAPEFNQEPLIGMKDVAAETDDMASVQEQLAARDAELERLRTELARRQDRPPRESFPDRMTRMKEEEPERYAEMVQSRTERKEQMRYDQATRLATFMDMDISNMTPEELANHNLLLEKLTGIWEKTGEYDPAQPPNRETMMEMFSSLREVNDLMNLERNVMLRQLGNEVGLSESEAEDFASYTESIISATTLRSPRGGRGPR